MLGRKTAEMSSRILAIEHLFGRENGVIEMIGSRSNTFRFILAVMVLSSCVGCDQATKTLAAKSLRNRPPQSYFAGTVRLELALNPGGFLSLGSNLPARFRGWIFVGTNSCLMLAVFSFLVWRRNVSLSLFVALLYVLAGGIGNMIDRVCNDGLVTDFLILGIGPLRTGIFNVADVAVTFGGLAAIFLVPRETSAEQRHGPEPANGSVSDRESIPETGGGNEEL